MRSMVKSHNSMSFKSSTNWSHDLPVISWFTNHYNPFFLGFVIVTCWFSRSARAVFSVLPFSFMLLFWLFPSVLFLMQLRCRPRWALGPHGCPTFHTAHSGRKWPTTWRGTPRCAGPRKTLFDLWFVLNKVGSNMRSQLYLKPLQQDDPCAAEVVRVDFAVLCLLVDDVDRGAADHNHC